MIVQMLLETTSKGGATAGTAGGGFLFATVARGIYRGFKRRGANKKEIARLQAKAAYDAWYYEQYRAWQQSQQR